MEIRDDLPADVWDDYAQRGSHYHRYGWGQVLARALGHRVLYLAAVEGERVVWILPLAVVSSRALGTFALSLPTVNYGGVVADSPEAARALAEAGLTWAREQGARWVLLRQAEPAATGWPEAVSRETLLLELPADPWAALDPKVRNQVRKAEKCGVEVGESRPERFQPVFARCLRDLGTPAYGVEYFREVAAWFPEQVGWHEVRRGGRVIGGAVSIRQGGRWEVPWACSLRSERANCPQMLLYWTLIAQAAKEGAQVFDFGRSPHDSGPYRFKQQWGAHPHPLPWQYWSREGRAPETGAESPRYRLATRAWRLLPMAVAGRLGPVVARWLP